jgi:hypothetical protein
MYSTTTAPAPCSCCPLSKDKLLVPLSYSSSTWACVAGLATFNMPQQGADLNIGFKDRYVKKADDGAPVELIIEAACQAGVDWSATNVCTFRSAAQPPRPASGMTCCQRKGPEHAACPHWHVPVHHAGTSSMDNLLVALLCSGWRLRGSDSAGRAPRASDPSAREALLLPCVNQQGTSSSLPAQRPLVNVGSHVLLLLIPARCNHSRTLQEAGN